VDARHRQPRATRELFDDPIQTMARPDFLGRIHAQDNLVRKPVRREIRDDREHKSQRHPLRTAQNVADEKKQRAHDAEEQRGFDNVHNLYCTVSPAMSPATSAARSGSGSSSTYSWSACAPSPIAPSPSSVGTPSAAVKFPSDPPPVLPSARS